MRLCARCVGQKTKPAPAAEFASITSNTPMELMCIDFLSLETSKGGFENIVITDHFTQYAQAIPTKNQTACMIVRILFDNDFAYYGFPSKLHSDNAKNSESKVIQHLCRVTGIKKYGDNIISPYGEWPS